ncbi:LytR/AlgR family response regulator transcription factor [Bacteroidota bacterium]
MKTKCIIVEDEPIAIDVIVSHLNNFPDIEIAAKCTNALKAFEVLKNQKIDLMFLDINMPKISGLDFLKSLSFPPKVIITTAYRKFALEGFELNVVDYLLKPISLERFMKAVDKYYQLKKGDADPNKINVEGDSHAELSIYVKSDRKNVKILLDDIVYIESLKDYVVIHKTNERIITKQQISFLDRSLPQKMFLRIHRSYIVSIPKITAVTKTSVEIGKKELPISRNYKNIVLETLGIE